MFRVKNFIVESLLFRIFKSNQGCIRRFLIREDNTSKIKKREAKKTKQKHNQVQ